ncbi:hypothetical protein [Vibrio rarus]|uniref:hypothetical protein n=1 Tax=Vibrio rarus TaxID=413403 RepID=UPI0021C28213|nr:hypothetical protein [Vibrio rarus]
MKKSALFAIVTSMMLLGCSSTEPQQNTVTSIENDALPSQPRLPNIDAPARVLLRGQVVIGHESRTIQPCNSNTTYWLKLPEAVFNAAESIKSKPYQPMYAEVFGYFEPATAGLAEEFASQFVVTEFNIISAENPQRCQQPLHEDRVFGNEPSWSATVSNYAVSLTQAKQAQVFPVTNLEQDVDGSHYQLTKGQLNIQQQVCRDSMSDSVYGWSAQLQLEDKTLIGCRTDSNHVDEQFIGQYTQHLDSSTNITLTLFADHQAENRYSYSDGSSDVVEKGHWQTLNSGLIQVTSVFYQGQKVIAIREFEAQGDTLSTQHESINGATYPLTNGGLTLKKAQ